MAILRSTAPVSPGGMKTVNAAALTQTRQDDARDVAAAKAAASQQRIINSAPPSPPVTLPTGSGSNGGNNGGNGGPPPPQPPPPPPPPPTAKDLGVVKTPGRDVTRISDLVQQTPADTIKRLAFEQLSAIELSQVVTSNTVDGVNQKYSIISNLSEIKTRFDTSKQLSIMNKSTPMTSVYTIDIDSKIPGEAYFIRNNLFTTNSYIDVDGTTVVEIEKRNIYIDTNGDLVIEFDNTIDDEIAQVQINSDGTIYEVTE